ncbi:hypothetical protein J2X57_002780 [Luteibacter sp. 1214]|uniref:hypothetical protein n=1 Tax=Luteibacter sp. 1214 TaxID=2817735 RepID=UPI00285AF14D|nr:hypothetical protein [Luteibacter sp. 1214]MDR6643559.1 hypothetical protein [Luteibacter sp. 1214]
MIVKDVITGQEYSDTDLTNRLAYLRTRLLVDGDGQFVIPVAHATTPHFRRVADSNPGTRIGGGETRDVDSHNDCRAYLKEALSGPSGFRVVTYCFSPGQSATDDAGQPNTQPVLLDGSGLNRYQWYEEASARIGVADNGYIQPDLAARYASRFAVRPAGPALIVEVVRTHTPEPATLLALLALSSIAHLIVFYFIPTARQKPSKRDARYNWSKYNNVVPADGNGTTTLRVSYYLFNGELYVNGVVKERYPSKTLEDYSKFVSETLERAADAVAKGD